MSFRLIISWLLVVLVSLLIFGSIGIYSVINLIPKYEHKAEVILSEKLDAKVDFKIDKIHWKGIHPEIHITHFEIKNANKGYSAYVGDIVIQLDLISSLLSWQPSADSINIDDLKVKFDLSSNDVNHSQDASGGQQSPQQIQSALMDMLKLLTEQSNIKFSNAMVSFVKKKNSINIPIKLSWTELSYHHFQLEAQAVVEDQKQNRLNLNINVHNSILSGLQAWGHITVNLSNIGGYIRTFTQLGYEVEQGDLNLNLNFGILHNRITDVNGYVKAANINVISPDKQILNINNLSTYYSYFSANMIGSMAKLTNVRIDAYGHEFDIHNVGLFFDKKDNINQYKLKVSNFNLSLINNLYKPLTHFLNLEEISSLSETKFSGDIEKLQAGVKFSNEKISDWEISGYFKDINLNKDHGALVVKNLDGEAYVSPKKGWLLLDSNDFSFGGEGIFEKPIPFVKLDGFIDWGKTQDTWKINIHDTGITDNQSLTVKTTGSISIPENDPKNTMVSVFGYINGADIGQRFKSFLPTIGVDPELYEWLTKSITKVDKANATFLIDGPITKMPFQYDEGDFNIILNLTSAAFTPYYKWPLISDVNARLWIKNPTVEIYGTQGKSANATVKQASFLVPNISPGVPSYMLIKGQIEAEKEESGVYLQNSPLVEDLGMLVQNMHYVGDVGLDLSMQFPLGDPSGKPDIMGTATLAGGTALVRSIDANVYDLKGSVNFHNDDYTINNISGWLGPYSPVSFSMHSNQVSTGKYIYSGNIQANLPVNKITNKVPETIASSLGGFMPISAYFKIGDFDGGRIDFRTDLASVKSNLPQPFNINSNEKLPVFYGKVGWDDAFNLVNANIHYNDIDLVGTVDISKMNQVPIIASIDIPMVNAEPWVDFYNKNDGLRPLQFVDNKLKNWDQYEPQIDAEYSESWYCPNMSANIACLAINLLHGIQPFIEISIGKVEYNKFHFEKISLLTNSTSEKINISASREDKEQLSIGVPIEHYHSWDVHVRNINIKSDKASDEKSKEEQENNYQEIDAQKLSIIPPANISVKNLKILDRNIHDSTFKIIPLTNGLAIPLFMLRDVGKSMVLGDARFYGKPVNGYLSVNASSTNWGQLLSYYGYPEILEGGNGPVSAELNWKGSYFPDVSTLSGRLSFNIQDGVINKIKPGLAKLIGLFSINTYLARLTTSYSDFTTTGMMFNKIKGKYTMDDGYAKTHPRVEIATPSFDALVTGSVNFKDKQINQKIKLQPHLSGAVAIAAGAVGMLGGPIVGVGIGLATYVVEEIVTNTLLENTGLITLHITGSLDDPKVNKQAL
jgi:uncharacterized protein YhdP